MADEKKLVVYQVRYDNRGFWAYLSNFLDKFYRKEEMKREEVNKVVTRVVQDNKRNIDLVQSIIDEKQNFRPILKPEKLYDIGKEFESLVCIYIETGKLIEIIDLHKLYLIFRNFKKERILVIIEGGKSAYFAISHFMEWINEHNDAFYNSVYFYDTEWKKGGRPIIRLQRKQAYAFQRLLPLLEIDEKTDRLLRTTLCEIASDDEIGAIWKDDAIKVGKLDLKNSALRQLQQSHIESKLFINCKKEELISVLRSINLLTLILFADSLIRQQTPYINILEIRKSIYILKRHAQGYLQLTENILFHTRAKMGVFCFRLLEGSDKYLQGKYTMSEAEKKLSFFEICISDYSGMQGSGNLARTFISKLEDEDLKKKFEKLQPIHFFKEHYEMDEGIQDAWNCYYDDVDNIGSHYGLKIFSTLVQQSGGKFIMESHSAHIAEDGEYLGIKNRDDFCMPGTFYSILMPINFEEQQIRERELDFGIANSVHYENDIEKISNIQVCYNDSSVMRNPYSDMAGKNMIVDEIRKSFSSSSKNDRVIVIDADEIPERNAELIYKAIAKMARDKDSVKYVAFYNCMPEFVREFWDVAYSLFKTTAIDYILREKELQIILFSKDDYEELIIIPNNYNLTLQINNQINFTKETRWKELFLKQNDNKEENWRPVEKTDFKILPVDIMIKIKHDGELLSIFEHYTRRIVDRDIQQELLGCKFHDTHMRLGSAIHVGQFYEAELLFGINLFVERFALLIALDLKKKLKNVKKITLCGYAAYSEQLIYKLRSLLNLAYPEIDVDYVILERESEERGNRHIDKLRYSAYIENEEEQHNYFRDRKIVCIIPISSTLKTNEKLINMFCEANGEVCRNNILEDYEVILVGNRKNDYWKITSHKRINNKQNSSMKWKPRFLIRFDMDYEESLKCDMCFPKKIVDELPLIEVNAASTIPNQAFGIQNKESELDICTKDKIKELEKEVRILEDCFLYSHTQNGDAHFLFYIQPNQLMMKRRCEIEDWLRDKRGKLELQTETYNVIFCPSHTRNVGFAECINEVVFDSTAIIIHDDIDKEYRSNFCAKYSNIYLFVKKIAEENMGRKIRFFYADDAILTGRSLQRAKSLLKSIVQEVFHDTRNEYCIFDSIFVLIDRNSNDNRKLYVGDDWEEHFFAFCSLHISSLRTHGDSCVLCNLENDANNLKKASAGSGMYKYWEDQQIKFSPDSIEQFIESDEYKKQDKKERALRRLICTNEAGVFLSEKYHGNLKENALICILNMITLGCGRLSDEEKYDEETKKEFQREYFLSYCKVISRPFIMFNKAVKEAVFDFLLLFTEKVLNGLSFDEIIEDTDRKKYLQLEEIKARLAECGDLLDNIFDSKKRRMELFNVLIKQLTELKSNYIIRLENINKIVGFVKEYPEEDIERFYERYIVQVKKLLGVSSDTSKSAWFDYLLSNEMEYSGNEQSEIRLPKQVYEQLYIENNRVVSDAVLKLCQKVEFTEEEKAILNNKNLLGPNVVTAEEYEKMSPYEQMNKQKLGKEDEALIKEMGNKIRVALESYLLKDYREVLKFHIGENGLNDKENIFPLAAQILLYQYIDQNFGENLSEESDNEVGANKVSRTEQGNQLAIYINYILKAEKTYILAETVSEADEWEDSIIERFNVLVRKNNRSNLVQNLKKRKEYLLLGSSLLDNGNMIFSNEDVLKKISDEELFKKQGYYVSMEDKILVWKLGTEDNQVYVYSKLKSSEKDLDSIRNVLQFSFQLNYRVFNLNNTRFFMELIAAAKNLSYSLGKKVITHTPYMIRMQQYTQLTADTSEISDNEKLNELLENRKMDIIMLLADLNISEHYRESLRRDYYIRNINFDKVPWGTPNPVFGEKSPYTLILPIGEMEGRVKIIVYNEGLEYTDKHGEKYTEGEIKAEDELICYGVANPSREILLMLYLMVTNSVKEERSDIVGGSIDVYLSKTENGEIRISNKVSKDWINNRNKDFLNIPPYDDEGISIWTVSRYLKSFAATILNRDLEKLERKQSRVTDEALRSMKDKIKSLPEKVRVRIDDEVYVGEDRYFSIVLPLLAEKYSDVF